jgi:hypothetical protein
VGIAVALAVTGCTGGDVSTIEPSDAEQEAVVFLRDAMQQAPLHWPEVPGPVAVGCSLRGDGVRFQYLVHAWHSEDAEQLARVFEDHWRSEGLEVTPSQGEMGSYGTVYSATARAASGPRGAIDVSQVGINLYAESACVPGRVADHE